MDYNEFIKDFIERTKANCEMIEKNADDTNAFEVTQLLNSTVGLLIIPKEALLEKIDDNMISKQLFDKIKNSAKLWTYTETKDLQQIARHLRNGIAHGRIEFDPDGNNKLETITIKDCNAEDYDTATKKCSICLQISLLREFLYEFSDAMAKKMQKGRKAK